MILAIPDPGLFKFLDQASDHTILTAAEERAFLRLAQAGNKAAQRKLCAQNLRFVIKLACKYCHAGIPLPDLVGEGVRGMYRAMQAYDLASRYRFTTYAVWWIRQAMITAINDTSRTVRITSQHEAPVRKLHRSRLSQAIGGEYVEDVEAVAKAHRLRPAHLLASLQASYGGVRLDRPAAEAGGAMADAIPSDAPSPEDNAEAQSRIAILNRLRGKLSPIQREIVTLFYGLDGRPELNLREIGVRMSLSHERIRQIRNEALSRMKRLAEQYKE